MNRTIIAQLVLPALLLTTSGPGCMFFMTKAEGSRLRAEVNSMRNRVSLMKKRERDTLIALKKAKGEVGELKVLLPRARAILLRNSARFGARLDRLATTVAKLQGRLENVETDQGSSTKTGKGVRAKMAKVSETLARIKTEMTRLMAEVRAKPRPRPGPKTATEYWAAANVARLTGRGAKARQLYATIIQRFTRHGRAEAAYYFTAKTYFDAYDYRNAVVALSRQLKTHPKGRFAARGRLLSARSYFELKRCKTAARILARLLRMFPHAAVTPTARQLHTRIQRLRSVSRYCRR
jgi:TolA-binding protein